MSLDSDPLPIRFAQPRILATVALCHPFLLLRKIYRQMVNGINLRQLTRTARKPLRAISVSWLKPAVLALALGLAGCANMQQPQLGHLESEDAAIRECASWFKAVDSVVSGNRVTDIASRRIAGYPYLRVDRFTAAFGAAAQRDDDLRRAWVSRMRALDADSRRVEIDNLPPAAMRRLAAGNRDELVSRAEDCAVRLAAIDLPGGAHNELLARRARVDDDYSSLKRALGLYELTRLPFYAGVQDWQESVTQTFRAARRGEPPSAPVTRYAPPPARAYSRAEAGAILARAARHPLGIVELSAAERDRLFTTYAPIIEIETGGDFDRIGRLYWSGAASPRVDVSKPTVYRRLDYTRVDGRTLMQLVYVAWLPERPLDGAFDLLGGHLDGIVWRVTLAPDGEPVLYDSIHPCGCYQMFFPTPRAVPVAPPQDNVEWAFVPASLPRIAPAERPVVSLQTGTHYLRNVWPGEAGESLAYGFAEYDELRSLPLPGGGTRSIFDPDGLVPGTERAERFLFWPMGIANPGAMRQAGTHATAFVGRRHFDDADLIEKRFRLLDSPGQAELPRE